MAVDIKSIPVGQLGTNCYLLIDQATKECAIVDPGDDSKRIMQLIELAGCKPTKILITHGHYDHFMATNDLKDTYDIPVYIHEDEAGYLMDSRRNLSAIFMGIDATTKADTLIKDHEEITLGESVFQAIKVPGHTVASVCYYNKEDGQLIAGDTLFCMGVGRTDLYDGPSTNFVKNIKDSVLTLPDETKVYPGHGQSTTVGYEKTNNPYF